MITKYKEYVLSIAYPWGIDEKSKLGYGVTPPPDEVRVQWSFQSETDIINPVESNRSYLSPKPQKPHEDLKEDIGKLCEQILEVQKEKMETKQFLQSTTEQFKGSQKLREIWPAAFHKYLPVEPPRAKRKKKAEDPELPSVPSALKNRLTTNLIEGSN